MTTNAIGIDSLIGIDDINVTSSAPNTAPNFIGLDASPTYVEQAAAFIIDTDATVADAELDALNAGLGDYSGASLQIADGALSGASVFDFVAMPNVTRVGNGAAGGWQHDRHDRYRTGVITVSFSDERHNADDRAGQRGPTDVDLRQYLGQPARRHHAELHVQRWRAGRSFDGAGRRHGQHHRNPRRSDRYWTVLEHGPGVSGERHRGRVRCRRTDPDSGAHTYSLLDNAGGRFTIVGNQLRVANGLLLDFEQATTHNVTVRTTDSTNQTFDEVVTINVGNVDPEVIIGDSAANTLVGGAGADTFAGGGGADILRGNGNGDRLDGGLAADTMEGGAGNDVYTVDNASDRVVEAASGDTDLVNSSATFALGANVEKLTLTGTGNINGTGNALNNVINGNAGKNALTGGAGNDQLTGGGGIDTMNGSAGTDIMNGGAGNDIYMVDRVTDRAVEAANAGIDRVTSTATFTLGAQCREPDADRRGQDQRHRQRAQQCNHRQQQRQRSHRADRPRCAHRRRRQRHALRRRRSGCADRRRRPRQARVQRCAGHDERGPYHRFQSDRRHHSSGECGVQEARGGSADSDAFFKGSAAHDASDRIIYNSATGVLLFDADGSGAGAAVRFATLAKGLAMTSADFLVI